MKSVICLSGLLITMELAAQNLPGTAAGTSQIPTSRGALAPPPATAATSQGNVSVGSPALAASSTLNAAALTNGLAGFGFTNQFGTNFTSGDLATVLLSLQNNLQQALSLLGSFNGSLSMATTASSGGANANFAQNLASGGGVNLAQNLAQSVATPTTSISPPATPASVFAQPPAQTAVPPTALATPITSSTNIAGVPVTAAGSNTLGGPLALNDSVRLLIILQNDMERILPEVAAATGSPFNLSLANGGIATNTFGTGAGQIGTGINGAATGTPRIPARTTVPRTLTPTGR